MKTFTDIEGDQMALSSFRMLKNIPLPVTQEAISGDEFEIR